MNRKKSRATNLTDQQKEYRDSILKPKRGRPKKHYITNTDDLKELITRERLYMEKKIGYLNNCIFWLNEFSHGKEDKNKLFETITAIENHCKDMRKEFRL